MAASGLAFWALTAAAADSPASRRAGPVASRGRPLLRLARVEPAPSPLRERFEALDRLLTAYAAARSELGSPVLTAGAGRALAKSVEAMASEFARLSGEERPVREAARLAERAEQALAGLSDSDPLPASAASALLDPSEPSARRLAERLREEAVEAAGRAGGSAQANALARVEGSSRLEVPLVELSRRAPVRGGVIEAEGLRLLAEALPRAGPFDGASVVTQDGRLWVRWAGSPAAEFYADCSPAERGGLLRVRWADAQAPAGEQPSAYFVARVLYEAGLSVAPVEGGVAGFMEREGPGAGESLRRAASLALGALAVSGGLKPALTLLTQGADSAQERSRRVDAWVEAMAAEGDLPFLDPADPAASLRAASAWMAAAGQRESLRSALDATLRRAGLKPFPPGVPIGQRTIELWYNRPLEEALARGQAREAPGGGAEPDPAYDPVRRLADAAAGANPAGRRLAQILAPHADDLDFEPVGCVGPFAAERAQRQVAPGEWLVLEALRRIPSGEPAWARAELARRSGRRPLGPGRLAAILGAPPARRSPSPVLKAPPDAALKASTCSSAASWRGVSIGATGAVAGPLTYDTKAAEGGGRILATPAVTTRELAALRGALGVVAGTGSLSGTAGIEARLKGVPALVLRQAEWTAGGLRLWKPVYGTSARRRGLSLRRVVGWESVTLMEGTRVRLDPSAGLLELVP